MDKAQLLLSLAVAMFAIGMVGVIIRRNVLVMLMCMELMLNGVNLSLVTFAHQSGTTVGAVMVFIVYVIMLLDPRDSAVRRRFSSLLVPGVIACGLFIVALGSLVWDAAGKVPRAAGGAGFTLAQFSAQFLNEYWLEFELTSVLLLAAIVAAISVVQVSRRHHG